MNRNKLIGLAAILSISFFLMVESAYAISWGTSLPFALQQAKRINKPIMAYFYSDGCHWCKELNDKTFTNQKVNTLSSKFVCIRVEPTRNAEILQKYGISGFPTVLFFNQDGNVVNSIVGYTGPDDFARTMEGVLVSAKPAEVPQETKSAEQERKAASESASAEKKFPDLFPKAKPQPAGPSRDELAYNGYMQASDGELLGQLNYGNSTSFVKKGDIFKKYTVASVDKEKLVLEGTKGRIILQFKKPIKAKEIFGDIVFKEEDLERTAQESAPSAAAKTIIPPSELDPRELIAFLMTLTINIVVLICFVIGYIYDSLCLQIIAKKAGIGGGWMAWIPILQIFLIFNVGRVKYRLLFLPIILFIVLVAFTATVARTPVSMLIVLIVCAFLVLYSVCLSGYVWYKIAQARGKSGWVGLLIGIPILPLVPYVARGYLAFSK